MSDLTERDGVYKESAKAATAGALALFGGTVLAMAGLFQMLEGFSALRKDEVWVRTAKYSYQFDVTTWGWIHLLLGLAGLVIGLVILTGQTWALAAGLVLAALSAISNFLSLPQHEGWAIVIIAIDIALIWAFSVMIQELRRSERVA